MNLKVIGPKALQDGLLYLAENPMFLVRAALHATRLRLGIPLDALRWLVANLAHGPKVPRDIEIRSAAPALGMAASVDVMGNPLRIDAQLHFSEARADNDQLLLGLRVRDLSIKAPPGSPAGQMLAVMDLSRPGNLMGFMPRKPPALVEARDDLFVLDLLKMGKLGTNLSLRKGLLALSEVVGLTGAQVQEDLLVLSFRVRPTAVPAALLRLRG